MWQSRTIRTFIMTLLLTLLVGTVKIQIGHGGLASKAAEQSYWVSKTHAEAKFDMILMGDSRTYRGVSPQVIQETLPEYRVLNFGYSASGLNDEIFRAAETKLDPASSHKTMVMGVTPYTLSPIAEKNNHFRQERNKPLDYVYLRLYARPLIEFLEPTTPKNLITILGIKTPFKDQFYHEEFYDNGWNPGWTVPEDPEAALVPYQHAFDDNQVKPELVEALMEQTRAWTEAGFTVFAFRPPTTRKMFELENKLSGFDEAAFITQFETAGGVWFSFPHGEYHSYDGSHLHKDASIQFSQDLAIRMKQTFSNKD
jgi:hypothetical protein